jgi:hypothetical protein
MPIEIFDPEVFDSEAFEIYLEVQRKPFRRPHSLPPLKRKE